MNDRQFDPDVERCIQALLEARLAAETSADPAAWDRLAAWYEYFGLVSNAAACRRRADHYRSLEGRHARNSALSTTASA